MHNLQTKKLKKSLTLGQSPIKDKGEQGNGFQAEYPYND